MNFHKILLKFTKIRIDFQLTNFFGEFYMIISLSAKVCPPPTKEEAVIQISKRKSFEKGDDVIVRDYSTTDQNKWMQGNMIRKKMDQ
jgi:hypothetical protein